jgi:hypothetical protein
MRLKSIDYVWGLMLFLFESGFNPRGSQVGILLYGGGYIAAVAAAIGLCSGRS